MPESFNFLQNKYTKWYFNIIFNAQNRDVSCYTENHHIIPKSLGGSNKKENLVKLTAREHFICHWLLIKMVSGSNRHKMIAAVHRMIIQKNDLQDRVKITGKKYEQIRKLWSQEHSNWLTGRFAGEKNPNFGNKMSLESRERISKAKIGKKHGPMSAETKQKIREKHIGVSKDHGAAIKKSWEDNKDDRVGKNHPMYGKQHSLTTKETMKTAAAKRWTPEARAAFSVKKKELNRIKKELQNAQIKSL